MGCCMELQSHKLLLSPCYGPKCHHQTYFNATVSVTDSYCGSSHGFIQDGEKLSWIAFFP